MFIGYDEDTGIFILNDNSFLGRVMKVLGLGNKEVHESELSINTINELKEHANKTTLTEQDIDVLYKFSQYKYKGNKQEFIVTPLKNIFHIDKKHTTLAQLMPLAYGKKLISENFTTSYNDMKNKNYKYLKTIWILYFICSAIIIIWLLKN